MEVAAEAPRASKLAHSQSILAAMLTVAIALLTTMSAQKIPEALMPSRPANMRVIQIDDKRLDESSGIAPSRVRPGVYYTHNDSGDSARFFAFSFENPKLEEFDVSPAEAIDWEDMATATVAGKSYVYCGDIGDNKSKRDDIHVYRVPEPAKGQRQVRPDLDLTLTYPDGPHNAETLLVRPRTGDITIVVKTMDAQAGVYFLPAPTKSGSYRLSKIGAVSIPTALPPGRLITGGAVSPDSKHLILRTYLQAYEFEVPAKFNDWTRSKPRPIPINHDPQGEGVTYSLDGKNLVTTSEGQPCPVSVIPIR